MSPAWTTTVARGCGPWTPPAPAAGVRSTAGPATPSRPASRRSAPRCTWRTRTARCGAGPPTAADPAAPDCLRRRCPGGLSPWAWRACSSCSSMAQRSALYLADADGELWRWTADGGWSRRARLPAPAVPGQAVAVGQAHLLYVLRTATGDQAQLFHVITDAWADWPGATPVGATGL